MRTTTTSVLSYSHSKRIWNAPTKFLIIIKHREEDAFDDTAEDDADDTAEDDADDTAEDDADVD